jgi:hypothetical protein
MDNQITNKCHYNIVLFITCLLPLILMLIGPPEIQAAGIFGNPAALRGKFGSFEFSLGGGETFSQSVLFDRSSVPITTPSLNFMVDNPESKENLKTEEVYLKGVFGLNGMADLFAQVGQIKIKSDEATGNYGTSWGGGFRVSPVQKGSIKVGMIAQVSHEESQDDNASFNFTGSDVDPSGPNIITEFGTGKGKDKLTTTRYDLFLGFSVEEIPVFRPYSGILLTKISGTEDVVSSGQSAVYSCLRTGGGCIPGTLTTYTTSFSRGYSSDQLLGLVLGFNLSSNDFTSVNLETRIGSQNSIMLSIGMSL